MPERKLFVNRSDVDDFPAGVFVSRTGRDAIFYEGLGNEKQSLEIDVQHSVEVRFGHVPETGAALESGSGEGRQVDGQWRNAKSGVKGPALRKD